MTHIDIALPFQRTYTLVGGRTHRTIEERTLSLRDVPVSALVQAVRSPQGRVMLEHDGFVLNYVGHTRESASVETFRKAMDARVHHATGRPTSAKTSAVPRKGVTDDGEAGLACAIAEVEAGFVVVEGCVGRLEIPSGTDVSLYGGQAWRCRGTLPWLAFPFACQVEAASVAAAMRNLLGKSLPDIEVEDAPAYAILDAAAVPRMAERDEGVRLLRWAAALAGHTRHVLGRLDTAAVRPLLHLREAAEGKAGFSGVELVDFLWAAAAALSGSRMPAGVDRRQWEGLMLAVLSLTCRLDAVQARKPVTVP